MNASQDPNAEGEKISDDSLSAEEFISQRLQGDQATEETESEEAETETEDAEDEDESLVDDTESEEETAEEEAEADEETEEADEGDEIDLLDLEPEQIQALAKKAKSRLLQDVGKLRVHNRMLEERLNSLETQSQKASKDIPAESNPFGKLNTIEEVQGKFDELEGTLETTDRLLEEYEDYGLDDTIQVGQQQFTKKQIRQANRNARDAISKYLPAQQRHIAKLATLESAGEQYREAAIKEVPEIADEKSEMGKFFRVLVQDPLIKQVKEKVPELGSQMEYILAHAVRSIKGKISKVPQGSGTKLKVKIPGSPASSATAPRTTSNASKVEAAKNRYEKTGSQEDWQAYRIAQMQ